MRIGILADIHEALPALRCALAELRLAGVDMVVSLGDACDTLSRSGRAGDVAGLLQEAGAVGVWGNHDVGLCYQVTEKIRAKTAPEALEYMSIMQPHLVAGGCRFSHVEPWLDPKKVEDLWYFDGPPDTPEKADRSFSAVPERCLFIGHFHRWLVMTPTGAVVWDGEGPLELTEPLRFLVVVAPVFSGWCAIFDTDRAELLPIRCITDPSTQHIPDGC